jgi:hypothetical protein
MHFIGWLCLDTADDYDYENNRRRDDKGLAGESGLRGGLRESLPLVATYSAAGELRSSLVVCHISPRICRHLKPEASFIP